MNQWTESQQAVIDSSARRLVCSAAAGSGKTAVMVERIVRLIREGADPFSFLVITFTNAAAAEMKERIRNKLLEVRKDPDLEICTIHSFCQRLIRQEFQTAGADPMFRICTAAERDKYFDKAFRNACGELKDQGDADYLSFTEKYEPSAAKEIVRDVYEFIRSLPDPFAWLAEKTESVPIDGERDHPWFRTAARMLEEQLLSAGVILRRQAEMFNEYEKVEAYRDVFRADSEIVNALSAWVAGEDLPREALEKDFVRAPSSRGLNDHELGWKDRYLEYRKKLKEICDGMRSLILIDRERMRTEFTEIRASLRGLRKITESTHRHFEEIKLRAGVFDFSDLEHKALKILTDGDGSCSVRARYRYIFVDECQDISKVQDTLIQTVAGEENHLFMVGDVKQSIYRFRLANPEIFRNRILEEREGQETRFLQENFRSRPEILETANTVFRDVMREKAADLTYTASDELKPGKEYPPERIPVIVDLVEPADGVKPFEAAADFTAGEIEELVRGHKADYRDIVILMPEVSTDGPVLAEILRRRGIPVFFDGGGNYFELREVDLFRNLLRLLDNPHRDLSLLTVLANPPFDFTEEELSEIRLADPGKDVPFWKAFEAAAGRGSAFGEKCRGARDRLAEWRFLSGNMPLGDFCWYLMDRSSLYAILGGGENGRTAQKNLRLLCLQASQAYERGINTVHDFLNHLTEQAASGEMQAASPLGEGDQMVRIMTMHKSKGLQFPVVFCLGLNRSPVGNHASRVMADADLGICLDYKVPKWRLSRKTAADRIFTWKSQHDRKAEKICLLYVAITRAQQRLYLVGGKTDNALWHMKPGEHRVLSASDYMDWIMPALLDSEKESTGCSQRSKPWEIRIHEGYQQKTVETEEVFHSFRMWLDTLLSGTGVDDLWKPLHDELPDQKIPGFMMKTSVTAAVRSAREQIFAEEEQTAEGKRIPEEVRNAMRKYRYGPRPAFLEPRPEAAGAVRGTVVHRFLSLVPLDEIKSAENRTEALRRRLERMTEEGVFTREEASWIRMEKILRFFDSPVGRRMLESGEVQREWEFNLRVPEREMIIQGMIDCAFREGEGWILLDYKTDSIGSEEAFLEEYRPQLEWYRTALEKLTGMPVLESWLYALSVDKAFRLSKHA